MSNWLRSMSYLFNFQLSSLFNWAWTFDEVRLSGPYLYFERLDSGETRLDQLLADFASSQPLEPANEETTEEDNGVVRLLIHKLRLIEGRVDVRDNLPPTAVETQLGPINISIQELNTLPDRHGRQLVTIQLPGDASLQWSGSLSLAPLDSEGDLVLEGLRLDLLTAYLKAMLPLESISVAMSSRFHYRLYLDSSGEADIEIDGLEVELDNLLLSGLTPVTEFINIPKITLQGGVFRYPERSLQFSRLDVENPQFWVWLNESGDLSLMDMLPAAAIGITDLQIKVSEISNQENALMPIDLSGKLQEGGSYNLNCTATLSYNCLPGKISQLVVQLRLPALRSTTHSKTSVCSAGENSILIISI